ncbi:MAG: GHMP kinase [Dehalococcoidia bacterium]
MATDHPADQYRLVRARTPLRISLGGGGTDVSPYLEDKGGVALTLAIDKYAYVTVMRQPESDSPLLVQSLDFDQLAQFESEQDLALDGRLDLAKSVIRRLAADRLRTGIEIYMHTDAPPGSGLGTSSAVTATLVGAVAGHVGRTLGAYDVAQMAFEIERVDVGIAGGRQDQYACVFGGCNFIEFTADDTIVNPLRLPADVIRELQYSLILCYTGKTRLSANIIERQVAAYERRDQDVELALDRVKEAAFEMKTRLLRGQIHALGELLDYSWQQKKKFDSQITDAQIDEMYEAARNAGALGGKLLGAGGGGFLLLLAPFARRHIVAQRLTEAGGHIVDFGLDYEGMVTWAPNG